MTFADRAALEGERTSQALHLWIDLTFGCHLRGPTAVAAKNVELPHIDRRVHDRMLHTIYKL